MEIKWYMIFFLSSEVTSLWILASFEEIAFAPAAQECDHEGCWRSWSTPSLSLPKDQ